MVTIQPWSLAMMYQLHTYFTCYCTIVNLFSSDPKRGVQSCTRVVYERGSWYQIVFGWNKAIKSHGLALKWRLIEHEAAKKGKRRKKGKEIKKNKTGYDQFNDSCFLFFYFFYLIIFPFLRVSSALDTLDWCLTNHRGKLPLSSEGLVAMTMLTFCCRS